MASTSSTIVAANEATFQQEVLNNELPVLVDFWAEWCGPCRALTPVLEELAEKKTGKVKFVAVNVDENSQLVHRYGIRGIPALLYFKGGVIVDQLNGRQNASAVEKMLV